MLTPHEKDVFEGVVGELRVDDQFVHRVDKIMHPRRPWHRFLAGLLWTIAPILVVAGGWTGVLPALAGCAYAVVLMRKPRCAFVSASGRRSVSRRPRRSGCE